MKIRFPLIPCCALGLWLMASPPVTQLFAAPRPQSAPDSGLPSEPLVLKAREAEQKHDFTTAAALYREYLESHSNRPDILQRLGLVDYLANRFDAAIPSLAQALKLDPSLWGSALYLGISYYRTDRFEDAIGALRQTLGLKPDLPDAQFWLGCSLVALDQPEAAIPYLLRASHNPDWGAESDAMLIKGYKKAAEESYRRIASIAPDSYRVHLVKAELMQWKGVNSQALAEARQALQRNPSLEGAHRLEGEIYWEEKAFDRASQEFETELELNPFDPESNLRLGEFWLAKGDPSKAVSFLNVARAAQVGAPGELAHFLGEAELLQHDNARAAADLERAIQEAPDDASNHQLLAELYRASGQFDAAAREERSARSLASPPSQGSAQPPN